MMGAVALTLSLNQPVALAQAQNYTLADGLLTGGLVTLGTATMMVLVVYLRRRATRQWQNVSVADPSYLATFKRTMYQAERVKWIRYALGTIYVLGFGLLVASALAALVGD